MPWRGFMNFGERWTLEESDESLPVPIMRNRETEENLEGWLIDPETFPWHALPFPKQKKNFYSRAGVIESHHIASRVLNITLIITNCHRNNKRWGETSFPYKFRISLCSFLSSNIRKSSLYQANEASTVWVYCCLGLKKKFLMSKLDDLLGKKKEVVPILDLSKTVVHSKDEYKKLSERVPDYKMRPIKVNYLKFYCFYHFSIFFSMDVQCPYSFNSGSARRC